MLLAAGPLLGLLDLCGKVSRLKKHGKEELELLDGYAMEVEEKVGFK